MKCKLSFDEQEVLLITSNVLSSRLLSTIVNNKICKIILFLVVLYGYETWPLTLREEHRLRVFENTAQENVRIEDGITRGWRKLNNEELHNLYASPIIISMIKSRSMRWAEHVGRTGRRF
jgi:hypothetical protein